jgi:hypothetical protein
MDKITEILIKLGLFTPMFALPLLAAGAAKGAAVKGAAAKGGAAKGAAAKGGAAKGGAASGKGGGLLDMAGNVGGGKKSTGEKIAGVGAIAKGIGKGIFGLGQLRKAKRLKKQLQNQPTYETSKEKLEVAAEARNRLKGEDPIAKRQEASIEKQASNQADRASKYATSGADVLGMLGSIGESQAEATKDIATQAAATKQANFGAYATAMRDLSMERDKKFAERKERYGKLEDEYKSKKAAGIQNVSSGFDETVGGIAKTVGGGEGGDSASPNASKPGVSGKKKMKKPKPGIAKGTMPSANATSKPGISPMTMGKKGATSKPGILGL